MSSLKKNLLYNFLLSFSQLALPLLSIPYISRVLDPAGIGRVSFIDSFTYYFITIAEFGIMVYGMREVAKVKDDPVKLTKTVSELLALHCLATIASLVLYGVAMVFVWPEVNDFRLLTFSLSMLVINSVACEWYFIGQERFKYIALRSVFIRLSGLGVIFLLIKDTSDFYIYYAVMTVSAMANTIWNNIILFREVKVSFRKLNLLHHVRFTWVTYLISLLYSISILLDNVLLGLVSTAAAVGYYAFAMRMAKTAMVLLTDALLVFFPRIVTYIRENNREKINSTVLRSVQLITIFAIPIGFGLFFLADELVLLFLGPKFAPSVMNLKILALFPMLRAYNLFLSKQVLIAYGREKLYLRTLSAGNLIFVVLTLLLCYYYADTGACVAIMIAEVIMIGFNVHYANKTDPLLKVIDPGTFWQAVLSAALFVPVIYLGRYLFDDLLGIVVFSMVVCILLYFLALIFVLRNSFAVVAKNDLRRYIKSHFNA